MPFRQHRLTHFLFAVFASCAVSPALAAESEYAVAGTIDVAPVWSGHPVGFDLLTHEGKQFIAFYDAERRMTVGAREVDDEEWTFVRLPEKIGWDSHNYITMAIDRIGRIHLSGNMHVVPLKYFRTREPLDIETFERVETMVGSEEQRCTYPRFFRGPDGTLIFTYRDGSSGNGNQIYNRYDPDTQTWTRLLDQPLTSGEGKMNAYLRGPIRGPDGYYHLCWVWRDTPDCATNHDLSYARSRDLVHWETSGGDALALPITLETAEVVDPVPPGGGMINGNAAIGFDAGNRLILSYHKFDAEGKTQIFNARREEGGWKIYRASDWDYRWEFGGGGSIDFEIRVSPVRVDSEERLTQSWSHKEYGSGVWVLDKETLKPVSETERPSPWPREMRKAESDFPGVEVRLREDSGSSGEAGVRYAMRWETLGRNRDRPHKEVPPPSMLRVYKLVQTGD